MKAIIISVALTLSVSIFAETSVERVFRFGGIFGQGAFERTEKDSYHGLNKRSDYQKKFTGAVLGKVAPKSDQSVIIRIPQDKIYNLNNKNKSYTVAKISPESAGKAEDDGEKGYSDQEGDTKSTVKIVKSELKVKKSGKKKNINGYHCSHYILTWNLVTEDTASGNVNDYLMTTDLWNTPGTGKINKLIQAEKKFTSAYLRKLGMNISPGEHKQLGFSILSGISGDTQKQVKSKISRIAGYPIITEVRWEHSRTIKNGSGTSSGSMDDMVGGFIKKAKQKTIATGKRRKVFSSYTEITKIGSPASPLAIPAGYTKK